MRGTLDVLNASGHLELKWDTNDPASVENAREEVARLKSAGYTFWLAEGRPADEVAAGSGYLLVQRVDDPLKIDVRAEYAPGTATADNPYGIDPRPVYMPPSPLPASEPHGRRGRRPSGATTPAEAPETQVVAVRPLRGG